MPCVCHPARGGVCARSCLRPYLPSVTESSTDPVAVVARALATRIAAGEAANRDELRDVVRVLLARLRERAPGRSVEVRVPPFGAVQCVAGPRHTRGTPPNVVETDPLTFVLLAVGVLSFADAVAAGRVAASGVPADLTDHLPLVPPAEPHSGHVEHMA